MSLYECRFQKKKYPDEGEMVMGKVSSIDNEGVRLNLVEYGDAYGLILLGELSKKRVKNVNQITKVGNLEVCIVLRVDKEKGYIDLSLAKVNENEKSECRKIYLKNKLAYQIMMKAAKRLNTNVTTLYDEFGYEKGEEFGSLYHFFALVKEDNTILEDSELGLVIKKLIKDEFQASSFKVRADVEVTCPVKNGILVIKEVFKELSETYSNLSIQLLKTPTYTITSIFSDKDQAYNAVQQACVLIEQKMTEKGGAVSIICKPKIYGEKSKYALLTIDEENENLSSD